MVQKTAPGEPRWYVPVVERDWDLNLDEELLFAHTSCDVRLRDGQIEQRSRVDD